MKIFFLVLVLGMSSLEAYAWGERGHDSVTRVAARLLAEHEDPATASWGKLLASREHMLAHISNVPDIVWRRLGPDVDALNAPSHYIDIEYILPAGAKPEAAKLPSDFKAYQQQIEQNCQRRDTCAPGASLKEKIQKTGHAPFRIEQFTTEMSRALTQLKQLEKNPKASLEEKNKWMDQALLYAGLLSHFIGDLANPHHTTVDYDGWLSEQGGLHSYFETELLDAQDLGLEQIVLEDARRHKPARALFSQAGGDPLRMSWVLAQNSHAQKDDLLSLDRRYSLLTKSQKESRVRATRRAPQEVAGKFRDLLIVRLAVGADALAEFWRMAWVKAGQPDVSFYRSNSYPVQPDFIPLTYDVAPKLGH